MRQIDLHLVAAVCTCLALIGLAFAFAGRIAAAAIQREFGDGSVGEVPHPDVVAFGDALHAAGYRDGEA